MDRTSILGDTIDYMKELLERINELQEEEPEVGTNQILVANNFKEAKPNEASGRNSPKVQFFYIRIFENLTECLINSTIVPNCSTICSLKWIGERLIPG